MTLRDKTLAINGGKPVRKQPWSSGPYHFEEELRALRRVFAKAWIPLARGENVMAFRAMLGKTYGVDYVVTVSSGTAALHVAMIAAGVGPGDEVIVPPITDYGTVAGIFQLNAVPVFCDIVPGGLNMDAAKLETLITKRTRAIIPVHMAGYPADMPAIMKIARRHGVKVIEDCAQTHMAKIGRKMAGSFGDFGAFSTNESKHMKTGEGGFILCKSKRDAIMADLFADKCYHRFPEAPPSPAFPAVNLRMSEINATLGVEQLKMLPGWIAKRRAAGEKMEKVIARYPLKAVRRAAGARCVYWLFDFYLDRSKTKLSPKAFAKALAAEGIPCSGPGRKSILHWSVFRKLDKNPECFRNYRPGPRRKGIYNPRNFPNTQWAEKQIMIIPVSQHTGDSEVRDLDRALAKIFGK